MLTKRITRNLMHVSELWDNVKVPKPLSTHKIAAILWISDAASFLIIFGWVLYGIEQELYYPTLLLLVISSLLMLLGLFLGDTYHPDTEIKGIRAPYRVIISNFIILALVLTIFRFFRLGHYFTYPLFFKALMAFIVITCWGVAWRIIACQWALLQREKSRWLLLIENEPPLHFMNELFSLCPRSEIVLLSQQGTTKQENASFDSFTCYQGALSEINNWLDQSWSAIVVSPALQISTDLKKILMQMRLSGILIYRFDDFHEYFFKKIPSSCLQDSWFAFSSGFTLLHNPVSLRFKRLFDIIFSGILCLLSLPVLLIAAIAIKLDSRGPVFYSQYRTGLNRKRFNIFKLRTMYEDTDDNDIKLATQGDSRVTRVGRILRATRINELPQLWNVFCGEMSLIGPRPEMPELEDTLREEIPYYDMRYLVKPGISGWAQVMHRYCNGLDDVRIKISYDLYYVKNYSFFLDLAILLKTIRTVIFGKGC
ncbi:MAG: exopolysaccharide biosynthesis polyprenyl glycosylphosphotransferase [Vulcanimicrobiota bacterium]